MNEVFQFYVYDFNLISNFWRLKIIETKNNFFCSKEILGFYNIKILSKSIAKYKKFTKPEKNDYKKLHHIKFFSWKIGKPKWDTCKITCNVDDLD